MDVNKPFLLGNVLSRKSVFFVSVFEHNVKWRFFITTKFDLTMK